MGSSKWVTWSVFEMVQTYANADGDATAMNGQISDAMQNRKHNRTRKHDP